MSVECPTHQLLTALPLEQPHHHTEHQQSEQESSISCLDLPATLNISTCKIRRDCGVLERPEDYLGESGSVVIHSSFEAKSQQAPKARFRRPSELRPGDFLGGSGEVAYNRPKMRISQKWSGGDCSTSDSNLFLMNNSSKNHHNGGSKYRDDQSMDGSMTSKGHSSTFTDKTMDESREFNDSSMTSLRIDEVGEGDFGKEEVTPNNNNATTNVITGDDLMEGGNPT